MKIVLGDLVWSCIPIVQQSGGNNLAPSDVCKKSINLYNTNAQGVFFCRDQILINLRVFLKRDCQI